MLFAIITCVSARCCVDRAAASSALERPVADPLLDCASGGYEPRVRRSWCRKRDTNTGVSGGGASTNASSAAPWAVAPRSPAASMRAAHSSAFSISSSRCTVRSAMRRTLSISARRSMAGIAHSSPMASGATSWKAATNSSTLSQVHPPLGVRDQRDRQLVDARIPRQRARPPARAARGSSRAAGSRAPRAMCSCTTWKLSSSHSPAGPTSTSRSAPAARRAWASSRMPRVVVRRARRGASLPRRPRAAMRWRRATARAWSASWSVPSSSPRMGPESSSSRPGPAREAKRLRRRRGASVGPSSGKLVLRREPERLGGPAPGAKPGHHVPRTPEESAFIIVYPGSRPRVPAGGSRARPHPPASPGAASSSGSRTMKTEPAPTSLSSSSSPPICRTSACEIASPSPTPGASAVPSLR